MSELIVDAHQHFWDVERFSYPWMAGRAEPLHRNFLPGDLKPLLIENGVDRTVLVQAQQSLAEARWLLDLAAAHDFIAAAVVWVDLTSAHLGKDLDELQLNLKFKGVRHQIEDEPDDTWMLREDVIAGFAELERRGIPYDLLVRPRHLKYVPRLRERCPDLRMVVDHLAKPPISTAATDCWARDIEIVAQLPDVWCKLSGMITEADWKSWTPDTLKPYVQHVVDHFGNDRLLFGSDWPVCTLAGSYQQVGDALRQVLGRLPPAEEKKIWGRNACDFYGLQC
jgi:L-fuconolactonase